MNTNLSACAGHYKPTNAWFGHPKIGFYSYKVKTIKAFEGLTCMMSKPIPVFIRGEIPLEKYNWLIVRNGVIVLRN